jgi:hypothetical protein
MDWAPNRLRYPQFPQRTPPPLENLTLILLALALGWFWLDSLRAREIATGISKSLCEQRNLQFLDQTVALRRLGVRWPSQGLRFRRVYRFDFSEEGMGRSSGYLVMLGTDLESYSLGLPERPGDA